jgi:hypothetical protein
VGAEEEAADGWPLGPLRGPCDSVSVGRLPEIARPVEMSSVGPRSPAANPCLMSCMNAGTLSCPSRGPSRQEAERCRGDE